MIGEIGVAKVLSGKVNYFGDLKFVQIGKIRVGNGNWLMEILLLRFKLNTKNKQSVSIT